jgi:hypothetical protein
VEVKLTSLTIPEQKPCLIFDYAHDSRWRLGRMISGRQGCSFHLQVTHAAFYLTLRIASRNIAEYPEKMFLITPFPKSSSSQNFSSNQPSSFLSKY